MQKYLLFIFFTFFLYSIVCAQTLLQANAGSDFTLCPNSTGVLGASVPATGGLAPYTYSWSPAIGLSSNSVANPTVTSTFTRYYKLEVKDANDSSAVDSIKITVPNLSQYHAGRDTSYCVGNSPNILLGAAANSGATGLSFSWTPNVGLNNPTSPNPVANPTTSTVYTLHVSDGNCIIQTGTVAVDVTALSLSLSFKDTTIKEGVTIAIYAFSSATNYTWTPYYFLQYGNTSKADVTPQVTTTYTVFVKDDNTGCTAWDTVRVNVIPDDELIFYSAFTPNGDGDNDFFYIGNIFKYPDNVLKVYNRYGQVIFTSAGYKNDWDGAYQGNKLPTGTYFYILDSGTEKGKYTGTVTILR